MLILLITLSIILIRQSVKEVVKILVSNYFKNLIMTISSFELPF